MEVLRKIKHWQIFLLVVGIPLLVQMIQNIIYLTSGQGNEAAYPAGVGLILILPLLIYYGWIGSVGMAFSKRSASPSLNTGRFRLSLWVSCLTSVFLLVYFWAYPQTINQAEEEAIPIMMVGVLVFVSLFTLFYCLSFMARSIVQLERGRRINSAEFFSEFVMAVMFPIGIWLLQPRINRLSKSL